jgi:hypothetical protein
LEPSALRRHIPTVRLRTEGLVFIKRRESIGALSLLFRYGENSGVSMHVEPFFRASCHNQIFSNSFAFKNRIENEGLLRDSAACLGPKRPILFGWNRPCRDSATRISFSTTYKTAGTRKSVGKSLQKRLTTELCAVRIPARETQHPLPC